MHSSLFYYHNCIIFIESVNNSDSYFFYCSGAPCWIGTISSETVTSPKMHISIWHLQKHRKQDQLCFCCGFLHKTAIFKQYALLYLLRNVKRLHYFPVPGSWMSCTSGLGRKPPSSYSSHPWNEKIYNAFNSALCRSRLCLPMTPQRLQTLHQPSCNPTATTNSPAVSTRTQHP